MENGISEADIPGKETDLVTLALALFLKLKVVHSPSASRLWEIGNKVVVGRRVGRFLDNDLLCIVANAIDDVLCLLAQFEGLEFLKTLGSRADARGLQR